MAGEQTVQAVLPNARISNLDVSQYQVPFKLECLSSESNDRNGR